MSSWCILIFSIAMGIVLTVLKVGHYIDISWLSIILLTLFWEIPVLLVAILLIPAILLTIIVAAIASILAIIAILLPFGLIGLVVLIIYKLCN